MQIFLISMIFGILMMAYPIFIFLQRVKMNKISDEEIYDEKNNIVEKLFSYNEIITYFIIIILGSLATLFSSLSVIYIMIKPYFGM